MISLYTFIACYVKVKLNLLTYLNTLLNLYAERIDRTSCDGHGERT